MRLSRLLRLVTCSAALLLLATPPAPAADANRLTYLDEPCDPYYVGRSFPKLTAPQWVGEPGVEAVVILSIDDMRGTTKGATEKYEQVTRPAIERMKKIDGRAHYSIMSCNVDPADPKLQRWLEEGVSLEVHTIDHFCPMLGANSLERGRKSYNDCVDLLDRVPNTRAVAFRTPCCDSKNTLSPRFLAEIFNATTAKGNFLQIDSSVFHRFTADDPALPRELVLDDKGADRYQRYVPFPSFANDIRNYPYPYVIGKLCWEFPCINPSDWQSHNIQGDANPRLLADWEAQLDATVLKQGTFTLVTHPYGWSAPQQLADLVDYANRKYGKRVKFLSFREAIERLNQNLLGGQSLRAADGGDNGVRLIDLNNDGYLDVVIGNDHVRQTRLWDPKARKWVVSDFPVQIVGTAAEGDKTDRELGVRFGVTESDGYPTLLVGNDTTAAAYHFDGTTWRETDATKALLEAVKGQSIDGQPLYTSRAGVDQGVRFRDVGGTGRCDLIVSNPKQNAVLSVSPGGKLDRLPFALPSGTSIVDAHGRDAGLRFVDVDEDGRADVLFSNSERCSLHLFTSLKDGWGRQVQAGKRVEGDQRQIPPIVRDGTNNGAWVLHQTLWVQNEDTATLPDLVDRRTFKDLLGNTDTAGRTPEQSLAALHVRPGFHVELMASEPQIQSPIAFAWGPDARLWVVEMGDYPLGVDKTGGPGGRIVLLESTRNDGHYDKATIFLDHLAFPTGVMPWGKGVLVTDAPEIFYAEDSRRDGHCDVRRTLFKGFVEGNQQHRCNGLQWGLDNWVHGANGHSNGVITGYKDGSPLPGEPVNISGRDFRIKPDEGIIEPETGITQYGHCMDDWGNWYGCDNSNPAYQFMLEDRYVRRNPHFAPPPLRVPVPDVPGAAPVYPASRTFQRFNDPQALNHFTSANSITIYRDNLFGPLWSNSSFVSEPVHDLVHREVLRREGYFTRSSRAEDEQTSEFFAAADNWVRPTMLRTGPDGALWVCDMYRAVIEHPEWIPKDWQARLDLRAGKEKGRLYRIFPVGVTPRPIPRLDNLDTAALVAALDSPSGWQRDTVQQMLVTSRDKSAAPHLEKLARESQNPLARLHALCTLDGLDALPPDLLASASADPVPGVRRQAVRLCEGRFGKSPVLGEALVKLVNDSDPAVRLQLACTLGEWDDPRAGEALGHLALRDAADRYLSAAVFSSVTPRNLAPLTRTVLASEPRVPEDLLGQLLGMAGAMNDAKTTAAVLAAVSAPADGKAGNPPAARFNAMGVLLDSLDASGQSLEKLVSGDDPELKQSAAHLAALFDAARAVARDEKAPEADRAAAVRLLARGIGDVHTRHDDMAELARLLSPQSPDALQKAAVDTLGHLRGDAVPKNLLAGWKGYSPALRAQVSDVLLGRPQWAAAVLDAIEQGKVRPTDLDAPHRQRLLQSRDKSVRARAAKALAEVVNPDRQKVINAFSAALNLQGNASHGGELFAKTCATCHLLNGQGHAVGPDLASVGDKSPEGLLIAILDPNRAVEPQYVNYVAQTKDGQTISGVVGRETGTSVTLKVPNGLEQTVLRTDLESFRSTGLSLMPEGLEAGMSPQDLADLIAFVRGSAPQPKPRPFDGNHPELVLPSADGALSLTPATAEIYGSRIELEKKYGNLGYWYGEDDHAVWACQPGRAGRYTVTIDYACDDASAGNTLILQVGGERVTFQVETTGNWDTYRRKVIGHVMLPAGRVHVTAKPEGKPKNALLDLRAVELAPEGGK